MENLEIQQEPSPFASRGLRKIIVVASIAAGIQFGWALQLSLLTPYVQQLGIPHKWASLIWLCGPVSGMLVQPIVGFKSDTCTSRFGRRRPFIASGAVLVAIAVLLIGYAADLGHVFGDKLPTDDNNTEQQHKVKIKAVIVFVIGFWVLDVANNMLQGPCRALLADLSGNNHKKTRSANSFFSFFMAVGNVLGFAAGSFSRLHNFLPFTKTKACYKDSCANLKTCFFLSITLLLTVTITALIYVRERKWKPEQRNTVHPNNGDIVEDEEAASKMLCLGQIFQALRGLQRPMMILLLVTCLNWIAWFPFLLFDTDWMGREVYGGDSQGSADQVKVYEAGVRAGALGLMLNAIVLGITSLTIEFLARLVGGVKRLWGIVNFVLAFGLALTVLITKLAESHRNFTPDGRILPPPTGIKVGALAIFTLLGIPQAITFSVPFAFASIFSTTSDAGQGLSLGVLNLAIVVPQMIVSLVGGPFDALFGGGNLPAFIAGAVAAAASGILALTLLPSPPPDTPNAPKAIAGGFH